MRHPDEDDERSPEEEQDDLTQAELGAVSEHSLRSAGYSNPTRAAEDAGYSDDSAQGDDDDTLDETPEGLGRTLLEDATEAPGSKGSRGANDTRPSEEAAVHERPGPAR